MLAVFAVLTALRATGRRSKPETLMCETEGLTEPLGSE